MDFTNLDFTIKRKALCDQIADRIEEMILSDTTQAKEKLPSEQALAAGFGVSRPVIREALTILKARGLISPKHGEGSYITIPSSRQVMDSINRLVLMREISNEDVFAVRVHLEVLAARLAAEYATDEELAKLQNINDEMERHKEDIEARSELDLKFHYQIAVCSHNQMLQIFIQSLNPLLKPMLRSSLYVPKTSEEGVAFHKQIIQTLKSGDVDKSEAIIREHLMKFIRNYEEISMTNCKK